MGVSCDKDKNFRNRNSVPFHQTALICSYIRGQTAAPAAPAAALLKRDTGSCLIGLKFS